MQMKFQNIVIVCAALSTEKKNDIKEKIKVHLERSNITIDEAMSGLTDELLLANEMIASILAILTGILFLVLCKPIPGRLKLIDP